MSNMRRRTINPMAGIPMTRPVLAPTTPKTPTPVPKRNIVISESPITSLPSHSASLPFDWKAASSGQSSTFSTPVNRSRDRLSGLRNNGTPASNGTSKRVVRKKSFWEKASAMPSQIWFNITELPELIPWPESQAMGRWSGGLAHLIHFCCRWSQLRGLRDEDLGWYDMYEESWFDWSTIFSFFLLVGSGLVTFYLFTRIRVYRIHHHQPAGRATQSLVSSPHAKFVDASLESEAPETPTTRERTLRIAWATLMSTYRFLFNQPTPAEDLSRKSNQIQELEVWAPGDFEKTLFTVYSPVHSLLWRTWDFNNWFLVLCILGLVSLQVHGLMYTYEALVKDRAIISAEVMNEYDQKFVNPRIFPVRRDVATSTNEAEFITSYDLDRSKVITPSRFRRIYE
ncbi:hypothetical protein SISNIDRAFT_488797 [Sistotremastrum niveocremeum HHB9708]|uniref:Uncharacterized protein n=1 Tax=Sistotremastrum niveocremeum HHB9708 TaxID=1314777 RepID=A0A164QSV6_9AGAM|nr:hypothetical protein SISNIDRAFT_488797 [Sistotremastrum niveocremeum HHB9708]